MSTQAFFQQQHLAHWQDLWTVVLIALEMPLVVMWMLPWLCCFVILAGPVLIVFIFLAYLRFLMNCSRDCVLEQILPNILVQGLPRDADVNLFQWVFADWNWSSNIPICAFCNGFSCESQHQPCEVKHTFLSISCIMIELLWDQSCRDKSRITSTQPVFGMALPHKLGVLESATRISQVGHME